MSDHRGCEVYVTRIPRDCFENELVPIFSKIGKRHRTTLFSDLEIDLFLKFEPEKPILLFLYQIEYQPTQKVVKIEKFHTLAKWKR